MQDFVQQGHAHLVMMVPLRVTSFDPELCRQGNASIRWSSLVSETSGSVSMVYRRPPTLTDRIMSMPNSLFVLRAFAGAQTAPEALRGVFMQESGAAALLEPSRGHLRPRRGRFAGLALPTGRSRQRTNGHQRYPGPRVMPEPGYPGLSPNASHGRRAWRPGGGRPSPRKRPRWRSHPSGRPHPGPGAHGPPVASCSGERPGATG